jgi:uncharacterized membrane protein YedE/YeeE
MPATPRRIQWPGLALAAALSATVLHLAGASDPRVAALFAVGAALGAAFVGFGYGFTGSFAKLVARGDGRALGAACIVPAVAALVVIPLGAAVEGYSRFVVPIGPVLLAGAALFGIGMQLAGGCGSGTLAAAGQGSRRMLLALPFFCLGGVAGSALLPALDAVPDWGAIDLADHLGPGWGLAANQAVLLLLALALLRGARPATLLPGAVIGVLAALLFLVSGAPWGITLGLTLWGAKTLAAAGLDVAALPFWAEPGAAALLAGPLFALPASLTDAAMLIGALALAAWRGTLRHAQPLGRAAALQAVAGGLLMGVGARLAAGCNIGAFLGGASSGSLHGLAWLLAAIAGSWLGLRLRALFPIQAPRASAPGTGCPPS